VSYRRRMRTLINQGLRCPAFSNMIGLEGWTHYNYREENPVVECDGCGHLTGYGWSNLTEDSWLCEDCFAREVGER